jgi:hypothetical protein
MLRKYVVLSPVNHNQIAYGEGEPIELDDKTAAPLLEAGVIEGKASDAEANTSKKTPKSA